MEYCFVLLSLSFLGHSINCGYGPDFKTYDEEIPIEIRYKTQISDPDSLHVQLSPRAGTGRDVISLLLSRVKRSPTSPSLLVVTETGLVKDVLSNGQLQTEKVFYKDEQNTSTFSINWKNGQIHKMNGHFIRDGYIHSVTSNTSLDDVQGSRGTSERSSSASSRSSGAAQRSAGSSRSSGEAVRSQRMEDVASPHKMTKMSVPTDLTQDAIQFNETLITFKHKRQRHVRERRQARENQHFYVEYVAVADYQNYLKWKADLLGSNMTDTEKDVTTKQNMLEFYQHVVHGMDVIFQTITSRDLNMEIILTGLVICNESNICPWTENNKICPDCDSVDDKECLFEFSKWRRDVLGHLLDHDHATLFTGYDLYFKLMQSTKTVGLAYMSNMCLNGSVSLVEERRNALSIHIAAHELGHSFGSHHDGGVSSQACPEADMYLMAPRMSGVTDPAKAYNPWRFSPCSRANIYDYIDTLDRDGLNCMENVPTVQSRGLGDRAGLTYSPDKQCWTQYGERSAVCREYHVDAWTGVCYSMACRIPDQGECTLIYPHDGTPCGNMRWCQQGACVYSPNAQRINELCPLGDDPTYNCSLSDCDDTRDMRAHCCHTCRHKLSVTVATSPTTMTKPSITTTLSSQTTPVSSSTSEIQTTLGTMTSTNPRSTTNLPLSTHANPTSVKSIIATPMVTQTSSPRFTETANPQNVETTQVTLSSLVQVSSTPGLHSVTESFVIPTSGNTSDSTSSSIPTEKSSDRFPATAIPLHTTEMPFMTTAYPSKITTSNFGQKSTTANTLPNINLAPNSLTSTNNPLSTTANPLPATANPLPATANPLSTTANPLHTTVKSDSSTSPTPSPLLPTQNSTAAANSSIETTYKPLPSSLSTSSPRSTSLKSLITSTMRPSSSPQSTVVPDNTSTVNNPTHSTIVNSTDSVKNSTDSMLNSTDSTRPGSNSHQDDAWTSIAPNNDKINEDTARTVQNENSTPSSISGNDRVTTNGTNIVTVKFGTIHASFESTTMRTSIHTMSSTAPTSKIQNRAIGLVVQFTVVFIFLKLFDNNGPSL